MMGAPVFALTGYAVASHVIPRGFALPLSGLARAQSYRRVIQRAEFPQGNAAHTAPPFSVPIRTHPYLSVPTAPPTAVQQISAVIQSAMIFLSKNLLFSSKRDCKKTKQC